MATAALVLSSASLTVFGLRQRSYRGFHWWVAALWLLALGLVLAAAFGERSFIWLASQILIAQWPILTLVGLRRFHARVPLPGRELFDWLLLVGVIVTSTLVQFLPADTGLPQQVPAAATLLTYLYAAVLMGRAPPGRETGPTRLLGVNIALVCVLPLALAYWPESVTLPSLTERAVAAALGSIVTAFIALVLVCDRTERELRASRQRLKVLANIDTLTNVPNRRHFQELAQRALRQDAPGSATLALFDIDHFKRINDELGHAAGDRALRVVSASVQEMLRGQDVAGRLGGDEFVLLLRGTALRSAVAVASRIVASVQASAEAQGLPTLTLSFGLVQLQPGESLDDATRRADQALYEAKRQGRSRAVSAMGDEDRPVFTDSQRLGLLPA